MGSFQCCGSGTERGRRQVQIRTARGMEAEEAAMQVRCKGCHTDQELT